MSVFVSNIYSLTQRRDTQPHFPSQVFAVWPDFSSAELHDPSPSPRLSAVYVPCNKTDGLFPTIFQVFLMLKIAWEVNFSTLVSEVKLQLGAISQDNEKWRWEFSSPPQCSFVKSFLYVKCSPKSWSKKCFPSFPLSLGHSHTKWRTKRCFGSSIRLRN